MKTVPAIDYKDPKEIVDAIVGKALVVAGVVEVSRAYLQEFRRALRDWLRRLLLVFHHVIEDRHDHARKER